MRFDANISVRPAGASELGTRTEVKNVNSLRSLQRAIAYEIDRQIGVVEAGGSVVQETRHWNEETGVTAVMRSKEESEDYRYFQEPDLLPLEVDDAWRDRIVSSLPELPAARRARFRDLGLDHRTTELLSDDPGLTTLFDNAVAGGAEAAVVANWLTGEVVAVLRREERSLDDTPLTADHLEELAAMVSAGDLSATAAKEVLGGVLRGEGTPRRVAEAKDLLQISDTDVIGAAVDEVLTEHAEALERMRGGDMKPVGFLVGQVMRVTGGKADPRVVSELIRAKAQE
jgi:aspartyl-tRNA(Asn)/glutamyl-tRNA(Gln) amidotransferase subunit B